MMKPKSSSPTTAKLALTVDLRAKILRSHSLLDNLYQNHGTDPSGWNLSKQEQDRANRHWTGQTIIYKADKKTFSLVGLAWDHSAASLPVKGLGMSHAEYFKTRKNINLKYPNAKPMVEVLGRRKESIFLPAELVCGNELDNKVKMMLPVSKFVEAHAHATLNNCKRSSTHFRPVILCYIIFLWQSIASYTPEQRTEAIDKIKVSDWFMEFTYIYLLSVTLLSHLVKFLSMKAFLTPGAQKTKGAGGLLPACGIVMQEERLSARASVLPVPLLMASGVRVPERSSENWAPVLGRATFSVHPNQAVKLNVVVFHYKKLRNPQDIFNSLKGLINQHQTHFVLQERAIEYVPTEDNERHWGAVERYFAGGKNVPSNTFVLDFTKPRGTLDPAYPVIKQMLTKSGYLSQFVNFNTYDHSEPRGKKVLLLPYNVAVGNQQFYISLLCVPFPSISLMPCN